MADKSATEKALFQALETVKADIRKARAKAKELRGQHEAVQRQIDALQVERADLIASIETLGIKV